jgi:hypothetical protein
MKMTGTAEFATRTLCEEDNFQKMLIREREQTEKSGRQFMLVLLEVGELLNENWSDKGALTYKIALALKASTREMDTKGWYLYNTLIGIICPDLSKDDRNWVIEKIRQRLEAFLDPLEAATVKIYTVFYSNAEEPVQAFYR